MKLVRRLLIVCSAFALIGVLSMQGAVAAQIGYTPEESAVDRVGSGKVDFDGKFTINYTAAPEVTDPHLIYVVGTDEDGEPFEWLAAQFTPDESGEGITIQGSNLQPGSNFGLEARYDGQTLSGPELDEATTLVSDSTDAEIKVVPIGLATETLSSDDEAESDDASSSDADEADEDDEDDEEVAAPSTSDSDGSNITGLLIGLGILLAVIIGAIVYSQRLRNRYT